MAERPCTGLDAAGVQVWCAAARDALGAVRAEIDALNVFPVPDADTGTNLFLTVEAAAAAVAAVPAEAALSQALPAMARGALVGARGGSGVILAQLLTGVAQVLAVQRPGPPDLVRALRRAADLGYTAVAAPQEGTMLTVARAAAEAAEAAEAALSAAGAAGLPAIAAAATAGARRALARTPEQLPVLAAAGVVDAGGQGLVVLLDTLDRLLSGRPAGPPVAGPARRRPVPPGPREDGPGETGPGEGGPGEGGPGPAGPAYEVMYLLDAPDAAVPALRSVLAGLGDSLVVVGGAGLWHVHVHVDDAGAAVEAGLRAGRPHRVRVTYLAASRRPAGRAVVALAVAQGLARLLEQAGAVVVRGVGGARPEVSAVLDGVRRCGAREVVLLPGLPASDAVARAAAQQARGDGRRVVVLPTRSPVQALAALAVHDPGRDFDDDVVAMTAAARATRYGALGRATARAVTMAGVCEPGQVLGYVDGDVAVVGDDPVATGRAVVDRLLAAGGELVTLVVGADAPPGLAEELRAHVRAEHPVVDTVVYDGGQEGYPLLVGVE